MSRAADETDLRKQVAAVAERMRTFCLVRETASRELIRKWAREIEACVKREENR
jgi:hypothetical protein